MAAKEFRVRTVAAVCALAVLAACSAGGGDDSAGGANASASPSKVSTEADAVRFLSYGTFGGSQSEINSLIDRDAADWLNTEFNRSPTYTLPRLLSEREADGEIPRDTVSHQYWDQVITANDQLRQRMAFALSQIFVYSDGPDRDQAQRAYYQDVLIRNAFGNYRDLLEEITYSPAMGKYLTYHRNRKGDERSGRMPDENYAREVLQLFSIGLVELNMDGTPRIGEPETYTNDDIVGLAKVFTGLSGKGQAFKDADDDADYNPMVMYEDQHSTLEKSFLGTTIPPNTPGDESIQIALDTIFEHPNVAPFISRQLIQRFTSSDPSPAYVERVATAFENGSFTSFNGRTFGTGQRGDLEATLAAILLENSLFDAPADNGLDISGGKIREPILRFAHMVRAFEYRNINSANEHRLTDTRDPSGRLGQHPFRSPSVFNYYRPGYIAPNTRSGELGLTAPELQIVNESSAVGYNTFMSEFAFDRSPQREEAQNTFQPNYTDEVALTDTPAALVDHLAMLLTADRMSASERESITAILQELPINTSDADRELTDRLQIVGTAITLVTNSPNYAVTW